MFDARTNHQLPVPKHHYQLDGRGVGVLSEIITICIESIQEFVMPVLYLLLITDQYIILIAL